MSIRANLRELEKRIDRACERANRLPTEITLIAITKGFEASSIKEAFACGITQFGENRVQEAQTKIDQLIDLKPHITWHMVGHLQTNKVRLAIAIFDIIHSIDSMRLAEIVNSHSPKRLPVLLEVNVSAEASKSGFSADELLQAAPQIKRLPNLEIKGLMTVAPMTANPEEIRPVFRKLREFRQQLELEHLSMGMTDDFEVAIEEGATMIRIGRAIFGERVTQK